MFALSFSVIGIAFRFPSIINECFRKSALDSQHTWEYDYYITEILRMSTQKYSFAEKKYPVFEKNFCANQTSFSILLYFHVDFLAFT